MSQRFGRSVPFVASLALATLSLGASGSDPFSTQLRWWHAASASSAWLPASVDFAAEGELAWASGVGASPRAMAFSTGALDASADTAPVREDVAFTGASGTLWTRAARAGRTLVSLAQFPTTDVLHRRTEIACYEPTASSVFGPRWRHSMALVGNGASRLAVARDGATVVAAVHDSASSTLAVEWLAGADGAVQASTLASSASLRELAASSDVARVAWIAGTRVSLHDAAGGSLFVQDLGLATNALALSGDGKVLAFGFGPRVRVVSEQAGAFATAYDVWGAAGELPVRAALSDDGVTLAIGWWNQVNGAAIRLAVLRAGSPVFSRAEWNSAGGYQNYPTAVALTPDGGRALFAAWGHPSSSPEAWLVDVAAGALIWSRDLPGSALTAALDDGGTRVAIGCKHGHANQFGSTGEFRLYDTGERDLQVLGTPSGASGLHLAARRAGSTRAFFVLGQRLAAPIPFPGATGALAIDRASGARIFARPADATGRADLIQPLPLGSLGSDFAAQAAFRAGGGLHFTASVVAPVVW